MAIINRIVPYIILRPIQLLIWAPWRKLAYWYISLYNGIPKKKREARKLAKNTETSLDNYDPILLLSATELARRIRARELTSEQVLQTYISRIERVNPFLNAVVADRYEQALEEAREVDRIIASGDISEEYSAKNKPFLGVPVTFKECIAVEGMPNTFGLAWRVDSKWSPAPYSSPRTINLTGAGFIILGVTNNPELLMSIESDNTVYGRCNNPYDLGRNPGGSSSGEGAIVGAGASVIGIGTDIGGSIRLPAYYCGAFGHKTTSEWVPAEPPHFLSPRTKGKAICATSGPICRYAEDIAPFVSAMIGRDIGDPKSVDLTKLRVVAMPDGFGWQLTMSTVDPEVRQAVVNVANYLGQQVVGKQNVVFAKAPAQIALAGKSFGPMIFTGEPLPSETLGGEGLPPFNYKKEIIPFLFGRSKYTLNSILLSLLVSSFSGRTRDDVLPFWDQLRDEFHELLGDNGVLIFPPYPLTAQPHGMSYFNHPSGSYTSVFNALGFPATQVPVGLSKEGLPLGVQVITRKHEDLKTIAVALQLERGFGGWVPPRRFGVPLTEKETEDLYTH